MKQRVHNISYLVKREVELKNETLSFEALAIPAGAELTYLSVVVDEADANCDLEIGLNGDEDFFTPNALQLDTKGTLHNIAVALKMEQVGSIICKQSTQATSGKIIIRAVYFLPSTIIAEY